MRLFYPLYPGEELARKGLMCAVFVAGAIVVVMVVVFIAGSLFITH